MNEKSANQKRYEKLLALGGKEMPEEISCNDRDWKRVKTFKHDFFAATGLYESDEGEQKAVLKVFRLRSYLCLPFQWLSHWEARHEEKIYLKLQDTGHVPKWIGRWGKTGIVHEFIPGRDLDFDAEIDENFFPSLKELLKTMHKRGLAYLDTNKPDNILMGEDGKCYLIDFQLTWHQPIFPFNILTYPLFSIFRDSDFYHIMKHERKFFPDRISKEEFDARRPWYIKLHRLIANPVRRKRRKYLRDVEQKADHHPEGADRH